MKKLLIVLIISAISIMLAQTDKLIVKAQQELYQNKYQKAIQTLDNAIKQNDKNGFAYFLRGQAYLFTQRFDQAYDDFNRSIALDSTNPDAYNSRGYMLYINGNNVEAAPDFNKAIALDPKLTEAYINRGANFIDLNKIDSALADLNKAIAMSKDNPSPFLELGRAYYKQKNYKLSIENYSSAIKLGLSDGKVYYNRGNSYFNLEDYQNAISDYTTAIKLDTTEYDAINNRAIAYDKIGKKDLAEKDRKTLRKKTGNEQLFMPPEDIKYKNVHDSASHFSFDMPSHWRIVEAHTESSEEILISPENIVKITTPYSVGIKISINRDMHKYYKVYSADSLLEFWSGSLMQNAKDYYNYRMVFSKQIAKYNKHGKQNQVVISYTQDTSPYTLYEYALAEDNILLYAFFQAPEKQFDLFKPIFDKILDSITLINKGK